MMIRFILLLTLLHQQVRVLAGVEIVLLYELERIYIPSLYDCFDIKYTHWNRSVG